MILFLSVVALYIFLFGIRRLRLSKSLANKIAEVDTLASHPIVINEYYAVSKNV